MFKYVLPIALFTAACASEKDVAMNKDYTMTIASMERSRMDAIKEIAKQGEGGVVAAALLMQQETQSVNPPRTNGDRAVDLAKTVLGDTLIGVGQIAATVYAADIQKDIAINSSDNNKDIEINNSDNNLSIATHTNDTMSDIAEVTIVQPEVVEKTVTTTSTTTTNN